MDATSSVTINGEGFTRLKDMQARISMDQIMQGERKVMAEIPPITESEIYNTICGQQWRMRLSEAHSFILDNQELESGFGVIRGFKGEHFVSDVKHGENGKMAMVEMFNLEYPGFPVQEKGKIDVSPTSKLAEPIQKETWREIEILSFHFHPKIHPDAGKPSWFNASHFDEMATSHASVFNGLKMRIESGVPVQLLRKLEPLAGDGEEIQFLNNLEKFYSFFMGGIVSDTKQPLTDPESIEGAYRQWQAIGMSVTPDKAQILLLYDNPQFAHETIQPPPQIFSRQPVDLENDPNACQEIIDYYHQEGYDADIVSVNFDQGEVSKMKSYKKGELIV